MPLPVGNFPNFVERIFELKKYVGCRIQHQQHTDDIPERQRCQAFACFNHVLDDQRGIMPDQVFQIVNNLPFYGFFAKKFSTDNN